MSGRRPVLRVVRVGEQALLAEVASPEEATAVYAAAREAAASGAGDWSALLASAEVVPAARTVLFDGLADLDRLAVRLRDLEVPATLPTDGPVVEVPTRYDGPDLADVAQAWDMTTGEVVQTHTDTDFVVAFCGFAPGFAYCTGLPAERAVSRLPTPRKRVVAGSVGLAGEFTGVYPAASPGGWRLVGRTDLTLWDPNAAQPATLAPGTRVRFVAVGP
jgi:KipI family sensor histidine kinase inhibitor